jgi:hypothetical protein
VPFSDAEDTYLGSADGNALAGLIIREIRKREPDAVVVDPDRLRAMYSGEDLEKVGWSAVGQSLHADYVLVGNILSFRLRDPGNPNLYRSTLKLKLKVVDAADGSVVWSADGPDATYRWPSVSMTVFDSTPEQFRHQALVDAARQIANVFCEQRLTRAQYQRSLRRELDLAPE